MYKRNNNDIDAVTNGINFAPSTLQDYMPNYIPKTLQSIEGTIIDSADQTDDNQAIYNGKKASLGSGGDYPYITCYIRNDLIVNGNAEATGESTAGNWPTSEFYPLRQLQKSASNDNKIQSWFRCYPSAQAFQYLGRPDSDGTFPRTSDKDFWRFLVSEVLKPKDTVRLHLIDGVYYFDVPVPAVIPVKITHVGDALDDGQYKGKALQLSPTTGGYSEIEGEIDLWEINYNKSVAKSRVVWCHLDSARNYFVYENIPVIIRVDNAPSDGTGYYGGTILDPKENWDGGAVWCKMSPDIPEGTNLPTLIYIGVLDLIDTPYDKDGDERDLYQCQNTLPVIQSTNSDSGCGASGIFPLYVFGSDFCLGTNGGNNLTIDLASTISVIANIHLEKDGVLVGDTNTLNFIENSPFIGWIIDASGNIFPDYSGIIITSLGDVGYIDQLCTGDAYIGVSVVTGGVNWHLDLKAVGAALAGTGMTASVVDGKLSVTYGTGTGTAVQGSMLTTPGGSGLGKVPVSDSTTGLIATNMLAIATGSQAGIVSASGQTVAGIKSFSDGISVASSGSVLSNGGIFYS